MNPQDNSGQAQPVDPQLQVKAELLRSSPLFVNPSEDFSNVEKQGIFLVLAGKKPLAEVFSGHWEDTAPGQREMHADNPQEIANFLDMLQVYYLIGGDASANMVAVSLDPLLLKQYQALQSSLPEQPTKEQWAQFNTALGNLFGYPKTAVEAMANDACLSKEEQEHEEVVAGVDPGLCNFRLSKEHFGDEIAHVHGLMDFLEPYGLLN